MVRYSIPKLFSWCTNFPDLFLAYYTQSGVGWETLLELSQRTCWEKYRYEWKQCFLKVIIEFIDTNKNTNLEPIKAVNWWCQAFRKGWAYSAHEEPWETCSGLKARTILTLWTCEGKVKLEICRVFPLLTLETTLLHTMWFHMSFKKTKLGLKVWREGEFATAFENNFALSLLFLLKAS